MLLNLTKLHAQHAMPSADPQHPCARLLQGLGEALFWVC